MLRSTLVAAGLAVLYASAGASRDVYPSPNFLFEPIAAQVAQCAHFGSTWRFRLAEALKSAQVNTANLFQAESWAGLPSVSGISDSNTPSKLEAEACENFLAYLSDPLLSDRMRGGIAAGLFLQSVSGCAAEFPHLAGELRLSWIDAFKRNRFDPREQLYDESVLTSWRKPSGDQLQQGECERTIGFLKGEDFEKATSEQSVKRFLHPN